MAFAMHEKDMRTTYDYTTLNTTYTLDSVSDANMASNYFDNNFDERTVDIEGILRKFRPDMFENLNEIEKNGNLMLIDKIKIGYFKVKDSPNILKGKVFTAWMDYIGKLLPGQEDKVIFEVLASHFLYDRVLASALLSAIHSRTNVKIANKLLDLQIEYWESSNLNEEEVYKLLELGETNDPVKSPVLSQWVNFVEKKLKLFPKEAYKVMLEHLLSNYKSMNALIGALVGALDVPIAKGTAQKLLDDQHKKWLEDNSSAADVFRILDLHLIESGLFDNPVFSAWVRYVRSIFSHDKEATKTMLFVLKLVYKENLDQVLNEGSTASTKWIKSLATKLQQALN
ncbi:unnamed protein product [Peronospora effusa]|uniref:RxLR effector PexRD54 WY domain-containing protein n=1 Tax=Peronospora effusa TaxID=542832 RepID=A0A3M6V6K6_9STRA|nr:hypothetical protein DD238_007842 [Peronospora effusa]RQM16886.1 hypothetical protein DD237_004878 [Peronospora effusa]CAI5707101.1 unnamed protein product [Peronospora effusa]